MQTVVMIGVELAIASYYDLKCLGIPKLYVKVIAMINGILILYNQSLLELETFVGLGFGIFLVLVAKCTREAIGYGDAYIFLLIGIVIGGKDIFILFLMTTFIIALYGSALYIWKRISRKYVVPVMPFFFLVYTIYYLI